MTRKLRLVDCNPRWATEGDQTRFLIFDCPEGHEDCRHAIPFTPSLEGRVLASPQQNGAQWARTGDTFEALTLTPSIRRVPQYPSREVAAAAVAAEYLDASMYCALHVFVTAGAIVFCADSH